MYKYNKLLDAALLATITYHLIISPYTKVEESFNIQAIHDILNYGVFPSETIVNNYDHIQFPGVVPRTFIGSLILAFIVSVVNNLTSLFGIDLLKEECQKNLQLVTRGILGLINGLMLIKIRNSVNRVTLRDRRSRFRKKGLIGFWFSILLLTQFHLLYYSSRTLPNFIALPFVSFAISKIIIGDLTGLMWLAFTGIVFRLEVGLLGGIIALVSSLAFGQSDIFINILMLVAGTIFGSIATFFVDSYFWNRWLIPELVSFQFNIVYGKSSEWGVEPWSAYFTQYLWQLFRPPVILVLLLPGIISDPADDGTKSSDKNNIPHPAKNSLRILFISAILFIAGMSFQPHKEWRFIIYTVPILTLQAANGLANISIKWTASLVSKILLSVVFVNTFIGIVLSIFFGYISSYNYPGGEALSFVDDYIQSNYQNESILVHMDVAPCMSGISKFGELHNDLVTYDKTEDLSDLLLFWNDINILITETNFDKIDKSDESSKLIYNPNHWQVLFISKKFESVSILPTVYLIQEQLRGSSSLFIFGRRIIHEGFNSVFKTLTEFLQSHIITNDYLYVYKRLKKDEGINGLAAQLQRKNPSKHDIRQEEEVLLGLEKNDIEDIDPEQIRQEVNEEIDILESSYSLNTSK